MKIYTKCGDKGTTSLIGGERVAKDDLRVEAYGNIDELSAMMAYLRDSMPPHKQELENYREDILSILKKLMTVEALICSCGNKEALQKIPGITDEDIAWLESRIDTINLTLRPLNKFTIPGGHKLVSWAHVCRTICRRAERVTVKASHEYPVSVNAIVYLNRLSDYIYQLGRKLSEELGAEELCWTPNE